MKSERQRKNSKRLSDSYDPYTGEIYPTSRHSGEGRNPGLGPGLRRGDKKKKHMSREYLN